MSAFEPPFEIHVHGEVPVRDDVTAKQVAEALKPLWRYAGARSFGAGAVSLHEEEPGLLFDAQSRVVQMCWTVQGGDDFRQILDDVCMGLNDVAAQGAPLEVTFFDVDYDQDDDTQDTDSRDDFFVLFVGPTPAAIMQVQRDLLVHDVLQMMERHFDPAELGGVVDAIDQLFNQRFDALVNSLELGKPPRGGSGGSGGSAGHGGGRRPRHLH